MDVRYTKIDVDLSNDLTELLIAEGRIKVQSWTPDTDKQAKIKAGLCVCDVDGISKECPQHSSILLRLAETHKVQKLSLSDMYKMYNGIPLPTGDDDSTRTIEHNEKEKVSVTMSFSGTSETITFASTCAKLTPEQKMALVHRITRAMQMLRPDTVND